MASITLQGNSISTIGELPAVGTKAPAFKLVKADLSEASLSDFAGKKVILNIFPSLDTSVCATSVRTFNKELAGLDNTVVLCISKDLPFAHGRFCSTEGIEGVVSLSEFRDNAFGEAYGATIADGPLAGVFSRAVVILNEEGIITYTEQVPEITQDPNYEKALAAVK